MLLEEEQSQSSELLRPMADKRCVRMVLGDAAVPTSVVAEAGQMQQALTNLVVRLLRSADVFPSAGAVSGGIIGFSLVLMTVHLFRALRLVYPAGSLWATAARALALGIAFDLSLQAYRFALFFLTFWST